MLSKCVFNAVQRARWLSLGLLWLSLGCSVYDSGLAASSDRAPNTGATSRRSEASSTSTLPAAGAASRPMASPSEFPPDGAESEDAGTRSGCGDGFVNGVEKCDVGIARGQPGACPESCPPLAPCVPRVKNGEGCQAECVLRELTCESGDGCCPGKCTKDNDRDCSARCGDGIVQESSGETCEPGSDQPCKTSDAACDDEQACTRDVLIGSAANCNVACSHLPAEPELRGDGCCPPSANANTDRDCPARCGNGVREGDEECDGGAGCDASCKDLARAERMRCMAGATTPCEQCACMQCASTEVACRMGPDADGNRLCKAILSCSQTNNCLGTSCYCGALGCGLSYGPCREPIESAVGGDPQAITRDSMDAAKPLGRAYLADMCRVSKCQSACR